MCGIVGFIDFSHELGKDELLMTAEKMATCLIHRGPDDNGVWADERLGVTLGHRRLSVIDLTSEGHQPMFSSSLRYVAVFNGEIYNYKQLRSELEKLGSKFRGNSDTEVLLSVIEEFGISEAVKLLNGMFAFAVWDRKDLLLHIARDRLGKKPLYYGWHKNKFFFSSELKAMRNHPDFNPELDKDSLALFFRFNNIPAPFSIYKGIKKLRQAELLTVDSRKQEAQAKSSIYWSARAVAESGITNPFRGDVPEAVSELEFLLRDSVKLRMISDVPLGAFLSGGIDSSLVVALMQSQSPRPVKTFTIGFKERGFNEANAAEEVTKILGTEHTELYLTAEDCLKAVDLMPVLYDEPFADSSQIPTFLVSGLTKKYVTVGLSGDGGDELFAGYNRYFWVDAVWRKISWMPKTCRLFFSHLISNFPGTSFNYKLCKFSGILKLDSPEQIYLWLVSHCKEPSELVRGSVEHSTVLGEESAVVKINDFTRKMMYFDLISYLPDDLLTKVDRASMGVSLEVRCPLLDYRIVEFAWRLPMRMKLYNQQSKWILRRILQKYLPEKLFQRPKMGFSMPVGMWLRGPLKQWAAELIDKNSLKKDGLLNEELVSKCWEEHIKGSTNHQDFLWPVLMFESWKREWLK
ncbi:MAG: asparagine synthase (glutamine-hydrolyzing) [Candidatus Omnitrophica bacterium]|nr:asparagine synthase (glutamine-hydrolyzing) [Candidatus Omnitrophota bacterium]